MEFTFTVNVSVERTEGKFASRDELADQIQEAISDADPGSLEGDNGGQYEVQSWDVEEIPDDPKALKKIKATSALITDTLAYVDWLNKVGEGEAQFSPATGPALHRRSFRARRQVPQGSRLRRGQ